jgi:hypothetical protein
MDKTKMEYLYILGSKIEVSWIFGVSGLIRTEGLNGGMPFVELSFDLLLINYPLRFSSGKMYDEPFTKDGPEKLREFRRAYNLVCEGLDAFNDTDKMPPELLTDPNASMPGL